MSDRLVPTSLASQRFGRYPAYRDSGVQWLGEIPAHWEIRRLKSTVVKCQNGVWGGEPDGEHDIACIRVADFNRRTHTVEVSEPTLRSLDHRVASTHRLKEGDLLLEKSGGGERQPVGAVVLFATDLRAVCSNFIARVHVQDSCDSQFLVYLHAALYSSRINVRSIKQSIGIQNLDGEAYLNESVGIPALAEQSAIADFLDHETARIDALVAKQLELIRLLREKRTTLISHAVTKGLDPDVAMKDSGVEWLGEIPKHWGVKRLKECATVWLSNVDKKSAKGEPIVRLCNYVDVYYREHIDAQMDFMAATASPDQVRRFSLQEGDVLITKDSETWTDIAVPALVAEDLPGVLCGYHLALIRPRSGYIGLFLARSIGAIGPRDQYQISANGITRFGLTANAIRTSVLPLPPRFEQHSIAEFLNHETAKIDAMIAKVNEAIEHLTEYRTSLIYAAVTGQINVRHHGDHTVSDNPPTPQARP